MSYGDLYDIVYLYLRTFLLFTLLLGRVDTEGRWVYDPV
jgi:hypothetical protein